MHTTIDYSKSPAKSFDAIEDIKEYLGPTKWAEINPQMGQVKDCSRFQFYCSMAGIHGFPVKAWYEHHHGQGSWVEPM